MNKERLLTEVNNIYEECVEEQFGTWINGLFFWFPELSIQDQKECFLLLLEKLLLDGKIVCFPPDEYFIKTSDGIDFYDVPCRVEYGRSDIWDVSNAYILNYIRQYWPESIENGEDPSLNLFWYDIHCPRIGWVDFENNEILAS